MKDLLGPLAAAALATVASLAVLSDDAVAQQVGAAHHRYLFQAAFSPEGIKNLHKQTATGFKAGVAKFFDSVGGKLESWYYDYAENTAYGFVDYPDEVAAAAAQATVNAAGLAHVVYRPVLAAEDADKAFAKSTASKPPQQQ